MTPEMLRLTSKLITLSTGQIIGHPVTRREYKRQLQQRKLERRAAYRAAKKSRKGNGR